MATTPFSLYSIIREKVLREGESKLMNKLLLIIDILWEHKVLYQKIHSIKHIQDIKKSLPT